MMLKQKIKFDNRSIRNHHSDFTGKNGKTKERVYTPFSAGSKSTEYKGLNLCEYKRGEKHFVIIFRIKGQRHKPRTFTVGKFNDNLNVISGETVFGIKQCRERLFKIVKEHCDERGHWIKDPNLTVAFTQVNQSITIHDLIIEYAKAGFEKMKNSERMTGNSIRDKVRHMFGYNFRTNHLSYDNQDNGDGVVIFKYSKTNNKPAPTGWTQLFKWYPSGRSIRKDHGFNMNGIISIFDHKISKFNIEDLRTKLIIDYVNQYQSHSAKKDVVECFRSLWHFAVHRGYMENDAMINPTYLVPIKKGRPVVNKYKLKIFSDKDWELLLQVCDDLSSRFPWQSDCIVLQALTGLRREEAFKLEKRDIKYFKEPRVFKSKAGVSEVVYGEIHIRDAVAKTGVEEWIPIIEPIKVCLDNIKKIPDQHFTYHSKMFNLSHRNFPLAYARKLKWLFCSTQVQTSQLFDEVYRGSRKTRLCSDKHCWDIVKVEMKKRLKIGIGNEYLCTSKMLRKTFVHKTKTAFEGRSDIAKRFTRHKDEKILEGLYDGATREEVHQNSAELGKVLNFVKRRA